MNPLELLNNLMIFFVQQIADAMKCPDVTGQSIKIGGRAKKETTSLTATGRDNASASDALMIQAIVHHSLEV